MGAASAIAVTLLVGCVLPLPLPAHPTSDLAPDKNYPADWPPIATASVKCPTMLEGTYENKGMFSRGRNVDDWLEAPTALTGDTWLTDGENGELKNCERVRITVHAFAERSFRGRQLWRLTFHPSRNVKGDSGSQFEPCKSYVWRAGELDLGDGDPLPGGFCVNNQLAFVSSYKELQPRTDEQYYLGVADDGSLIMKVQHLIGPLAHDTWHRFKKVP